MTEREFLFPISHLDSEVLGECTEIAHSKTSHHLVLEVVNVLCTCAGDDQVIHIHTDDELLLPPSPCVEHVLGCALCEPKLAQRGVKLDVPRSWGLPQPVERLAQSEHPVLCSLDGETQRLPDEDRLRQLAVEEG